MASKRLARLNEQLKRELSEMIRTQVRDPRVGLVTITATEVAGDLGSARVFVRALGDEAEVKESLAGLEAAAPFLRHALAQVMRVRTVPELRFRIDQSLDHARRIEQILSDVIPAHAEEAVDVDGTGGDEAGADSEE